jgi:hypothetical protein
VSAGHTLSGVFGESQHARDACGIPERPIAAGSGLVQSLGKSTLSRRQYLAARSGATSDGFENGIPFSVPVRCEIRESQTPPLRRPPSPLPGRCFILIAFVSIPPVAFWFFEIVFRPCDARVGTNSLAGRVGLNPTQDNPLHKQNGSGRRGRLWFGNGHGGEAVPGCFGTGWQGA